MSVARIASRYAKSLIDLSIERGSLEKCHEDMQTFKSALASRDFKLLLKSPIILESKKAQIFDALFADKVDELSMAFFKIVLKKGREAYLPAIAEEFLVQYKIFKHVSAVKLTTASTLGDASVNSIRQKLNESSITDDNIDLSFEVNPDIIGGFILEFDDKLYDASVAHKLELLKKDFSKNTYIKNF